MSSLVYAVSCLAAIRRLKSAMNNINWNVFLCFIVSQVFRHGPRTPADTYPTDPHINQTFHPFGWGHITNVRHILSIGYLFEFESGVNMRVFRVAGWQEILVWNWTMVAIPLWQLLGQGLHARRKWLLNWLESEARHRVIWFRWLGCVGTNDRCDENQDVDGNSVGRSFPTKGLGSRMESFPQLATNSNFLGTARWRYREFIATVSKLDECDMKC